MNYLQDCLLKIINMENFKLRTNSINAIQFTNTFENRLEIKEILKDLFITIQEPENREYTPYGYGELWYYSADGDKIINRNSVIYTNDYLIQIDDRYFIKMTKEQMDNLFIKDN